MNCVASQVSRATQDLQLPSAFSTTEVEQAGNCSLSQKAKFISAPDHRGCKAPVCEDQHNTWSCHQMPTTVWPRRGLRGLKFLLFMCGGRALGSALFPFFCRLHQQPGEQEQRHASAYTAILEIIC